MLFVLCNKLDNLIRYAFHFSRLRSSLFKADEDVGEAENGLEKIESFNGYDFDKQFALRFNEYFKEGIFGKVNISTKASDDVKKEVVEFVLQKVSATDEAFILESTSKNMTYPEYNFFS